MIAQVITENGQKKIIPLTADAGAGNPVGTIIPMYKKSSPSGYLYCDGSTFDETKYPLLYAYLGSNKLPDYREFALVGAEENTTDVYNASTNPTGTIHDHDVYTEGQAKDDQNKRHTHDIETVVSNQHYILNYINSTATNGQQNGTLIVGTGYTLQAAASGGTVTRGKRKAVYFYIKATSGLSENAQDNVINTLNEQRSYSTEEVNTGKKWIDGKPIYRKVLTTTSAINTDSFYWGGLETEVQNLNISSVINVSGVDNTYGKTFRPMGFSSSSGFSTFSTGLAQGANIIIEYTKTN